MFPTEWKTAIVTCIPKKNVDLKNPANYRPISLLPVIGKLFESLIRSRLLIFADEHIPTYQFGFRRNVSTIHPLSILVSNIQTAKVNKKKSAVIFLDIQKAFDSVWHRGLLYKLSLLNIPYYLINILRQFLSNRSSQIKIHNFLSDPIFLEQGVPQGSPISPTLYNLYCHDIYNSDPNIYNPQLYALLYADDTALVSHSRSTEEAVTQLESLLQKTLSWARKWRIKINLQKTQFLIPFHRIVDNSPSIQIHNTRISPAKNCNYLGVLIDPKLKFTGHAIKTKMKAKNRASQFRGLTYKDRGIDIETAVHIYKMICRPILEYGSLLLNNIGNSARYSLNVGERGALRNITRLRHPNNPLYNPSNELLYQSTNITPITTRIETLSRKIANRFPPVFHLFLNKDPNLVTANSNSTILDTIHKYKEEK